MKFFGKYSGWALGFLVMIQFSGCAMLPKLSAGPEPGTVGFYEISPVPGRYVTADVKARRMSNPGDRIYVYRVDDDKVVLGEGTKTDASKIKHFDDVSAGVVITPAGAKQLTSYLEKVIAQYDSKDKKSSLYLDFQILVEKAVEEKAASPIGGILKGESTKGESPKVDSPKEEYIHMRFQYVFNMADPESTETTTYYLGVGKGIKQLTYNEIKILLSNLQKP